MRDLKEIRKDIDKIDNQLIELFKQRMDCARDVGIYKQANNIVDETPIQTHDNH